MAAKEQMKTMVLTDKALPKLTDCAKCGITVVGKHLCDACSGTIKIPQGTVKP